MGDSGKARIFIVTAVAVVACLLWAAPPASAWTDSKAVRLTVAADCGKNAQYPRFCSPGSVMFDVEPMFVKMSGGLGIDVRLYFKSGKRWLDVPVKTSFYPNPNVEAGSDMAGTFGEYALEVFPMQSRMSSYGVVGYYMLAFGEYNRAQWSCSIYSYDVCTWRDGYTRLTKVRFHVDAAGRLDRQQLAVDFEPS